MGWKHIGFTALALLAGGMAASRGQAPASSGEIPCEARQKSHLKMGASAGRGIEGVSDCAAAAEAAKAMIAGMKSFMFMLPDEMLLIA